MTWTATMTAPEADFSIDSKLREKLIEEGKRQLQDLIAYNARNEAEGCPEKNVYFFSLQESDNWIEYINTGGQSSGILGTETITDLNSELADLVLETDKVIYVCLVTELPVKVESYFALPNTISNIKQTYEELGTEDGQQSSANISAAQRDFDGILQAIHTGTYSNISNSSGYTEYQSANPPNRLLLSAAKLVSTLFDEGTGGVKSQTAIIRGKITDGYFDTYESQLADYQREYDNNGNTLERDIRASIDFVISERHDPTKARDEVNLDGQQGLADHAHSKSNNTGFDVNGNLFLYDYAGVYNDDPTVKDSLVQILQGTLVGSNSKMKLFITDKDVAESNRTQIENLDLTLGVHANTMVLWIDIKENGSVNSTVRYSPDLQAIVSAHMNNRTIRRIVGVAINTLQVSATQQVKFVAECLFRATDFVSKMIAEYAIIPDKYFRKDLPDYDPSFKRVFTVIMPALYFSDALVAPLMAHYNIQLDHGVGMDDLTFALTCGLWNGLMNELKGIADLVAMASGYYVDEKKQQEVQQLFATLSSGNLWELLKASLTAAHTGPTCKVAHQIGKDVMFVAITFVPIAGAVTKAKRLGDLGTMTKVCTKLAQALDVINPLTYAFKGMGWVMKKSVNSAGQAVTLVGKKIANDLDEVFRIQETTLILRERYYIATQAALVSNLGPLESLALKARIIFSPHDPTFDFALLTNSGQIKNVSVGTDELVLFAKKSGDPLDGAGNPIERFVRRTVAEEVITALKLRFLSEGDTHFDIVAMYGANQADDICYRLAHLPYAAKILDDIDLRDAIKGLGNAERKQFFDDIVEAFEPDQVPVEHIGLKLEDFTVGKVEAWNTTRHTDIPAGIRKNNDNLSFLADYLSRFPYEGTTIRNNLRSATNKQIWLSLFKKEDFIKVNSLVKSTVSLTKMNHVNWAEKYADDIISNLQRIKDKYGDDLGRWNEIETTDVTIDPNYDGSNLGASTVMSNGNSSTGDFHRLTINTAGLTDFSTYQSFLNSFDGQAGYWYRTDLEYLFNHELGHKLTSPNDMGELNPAIVFFDNEPAYDALAAISERSLEKMDEAFAEIFAAFENGHTIHPDLKYIFNEITDYPIP